jgi:hypothetical protein
VGKKVTEDGRRSLLTKEERYQRKRQTQYDWSVRNKDRVTENRRRWIAENSDRVKAMARENYLAHKKERLEKAKLNPKKRDKDTWAMWAFFARAELAKPPIDLKAAVLIFVKLRRVLREKKKEANNG